VSAATGELAKLRAGCAGLQKRAAEAQAKIDNAGGEPLRRARERAAKLTAKIAETEAASAKMRANAKAAAKQLEKLRKDAVKQGSETERLEADIAAAMDALKQLETDAMGVMTRAEELAVAKAEAERALEEAKRRRDDKGREVGVIKGVQAELEAALEKLKGARREAAAAAKGLEKAVAADAAKLAEYTDNAPAPELTEQQLALEGGALDAAVDAAFFRVTVLDEELRAMSPDLTAIDAWRCARVFVVGAFCWCCLCSRAAQCFLRCVYSASKTHTTIQNTRLSPATNKTNQTPLKHQTHHQHNPTAPRTPTSRRARRSSRTPPPRATPRAPSTTACARRASTASWRVRCLMVF
jgi:myosin heavy subunit